jgi:hypothetical protein
MRDFRTCIWAVLELRPLTEYRFRGSSLNIAALTLNLGAKP